MLNVLIPSRTDEYLDALLSSMERSQPGSTEQVVVGDNGLSSALKKRWPQVKFVDVPNPFVFAKAINACAANAKPGSDLIVLNDDTEVISPHWLTMIEAFLQKQGPSFNYGMLSLRIEGGVGNEDQKAPVAADAVVTTNRVVCFVAVVIPYKVWNRVGPLDERFVGYGMDDNDYCRRCVDAGFKLGVTGAAIVKHGMKKIRGRMLKSGAFAPDPSGDDQTTVPHSSSYILYNGSEEWQRLYELNVEIFKAKWGIVDEEVADAPQAPARRKVLNLGCGLKPVHVKHEDWINVDIRPLPGVDVVRDLRRGIPFADATFDHVFADNVLEHFDNEDFIFLLNEIDRVLKVGGTVEIIVPDGRSQAAVQDPTHKMFIVPRSALYWNQVQTPNGGKAVGITANLVLYKNVEQFGDPKTEAFLQFCLRKEALK